MALRPICHHLTRRSAPFQRPGQQILSVVPVIIHHWAYDTVILRPDYLIMIRWRQSLSPPPPPPSLPLFLLPQWHCCEALRAAPGPCIQQSLAARWHCRQGGLFSVFRPGPPAGPIWPPASLVFAANQSYCSSLPPSLSTSKLPYGLDINGTTIDKPRKKTII